MVEEKRILVVDDDAMSLRMAEFILKKTPHTILKASSGDECIAILKEENVDLLLLDVEMPQKNGIETLREIRGIDRLANLPVIFLTGTGDTERMAEADNLGAKDFAIKPLKPQELLERVEKVLV
jgi:DNA-binding response OmpR family regulator